MIRVYLLLPLLSTLAVLHTLPFLPRPQRLFGVAVPREVRYGPAGRRLLRRYQFTLLPWTCAAFLAVLWLAPHGAAAWMPVLFLAATSASLWMFFRARKEAVQFALPPPSSREALMAPDDSHLRPLLLFLPPLAILAGTALYLHLRWDAIPARFPVHWGADGSPNGWSTRMAAGVYGPLVLGGVIVVFIGLVFALTMWGSRRSARQPAGQAIMLSVAYIIAAAFSMAGLLPLRVVPVWGLLAFSAFSVMILVAVAWRAVSRAPESGGESTPELCWRWGMFYYNPDDPALFVEKRIGIGWTFNFANRLSWVVLSVMLLLPLGVVFLARAFTTR